MIRLDNTSAYAILFFAAIAAGYVALPTSSQLTAEEAAFLLADSGAAAIAVADHLPIGQIPGGVRIFEAGEITRAMMRPVRAPATRQPQPMIPPS